MNVIKICNNCRICKGSSLEDIISLGEQFITSRFPTYGDYSTPKTSITLCLCNDCGLVQLKETTNSNELYEYEYGYRSGISNTMKTHLRLYQEEILNKVYNLQDGDAVLDIGSNDSTMLQYYPNKLKRIGMDPTGSQFSHFYGEVELVPTYFTFDNFTEKYKDHKCKIVSSISMFYDLPDPVQFAKDIYNILEDDGIWTCEQSYLLTMLKMNSIDTICHEHLEYYALSQVKRIADLANFKIIDVLFNACNGGSFRIYFAKKSSLQYSEATELISSILKEEEEYGIMNKETYKNFMDNCDREVNYLKTFIENVNKNGKTVYIYGASTKGNCLLQYANIGETDLKYAVERNLDKVGKMTSTGIEIISEETMRMNPPDYLLCLPYHFKEEILKRETEFLEGGGQFIFPFPQFEILGSKPKLLITGCDGMIATYVKTSVEFNKDYNLYGIGHSPPPVLEKNITKFYFDLKDTNQLEFVVRVIKPDVIVHLASFSNSQFCLSHPIETLYTNGMITANLCDIIHRNGLSTKLFNSSSSEMYKGYIDYEVKEDDHNMFHLHPYSIAKIMGHSVVDFYRTTYNLPFSNGIFFTIESPLKKQSFLLNKVSNHIQSWLNGDKTPLRVGNLDSYRNILQADKAVEYIHKIVSKEEGRNYLICDEKSIKVFDLVVGLYSSVGISLKQTDNVLYNIETNEPVVIIETNLGNEIVPTNIRGYPSKV